jgi:GWxTD domain-containing protein
MLRQAALLTILLLTPSLATASAAQTAGRDPGVFRDSLATVTDAPALTRMERSLELPSGARSVGPVLERGLIAHRLWQLTGDREDANRARDAFERAEQRFPNEAWAHYGIALAMADGPELRVTSLGGALSDVTLVQSFAEILRKDPRAKARTELRRALSLRPAFGDAAVLLSELAMADGGSSRPLLVEARDALLQARNAGAANVSAALSRMETALGNYAEAARLSAEAASRGDASALAAAATATLLQPGKEEEGGRLYAAALAGLTLDAANVLFDDVQVILTPAEAAEWKVAKTLDEKRTWLTRFWNRRAAESGVTVAERQAMHYRRVAVAKQRYLRNSRRGSAGSGILTADKPVGTYPFDQRGVILIRHGVPLTIVSTHAPGVLPNETWVYDLPGIGRQLFNFAILRGSQDYVLVSDITKVIDPINNVEGFMVRNQVLLQALQDRVQYDPSYRSVLGRLQGIFNRTPNIRLDDGSVRAAMSSAEAEYRKGAREALRTDTYRHAYEDSIPFLHDVFTMRSPFSRTELTAAVALPARDMIPLIGSAGTRYGVRLSVILIDTLQQSVTRADTTIVIDEGRLLASNDYVRAHVTLPVIPSAHTLYKIAAEDIVSGRGALIDGNHALRDYSSSERLLVSDIVLAIPDSAGEWVRGNERLALALPRSFEPAHPFTVFYELYNLKPGEAYTTHITVSQTGGGVRGLLGGNARPIDVRFDGIAQPDASGIQHEIRRLGSDLGEGTYKLTVEVIAKGSSRTATTETVFTVTN